MASILHTLLYSNDIDIASIIVSASCHHWIGDGEHTIREIMGTDQEYNSGADATEWHPMDPGWIYDTLNTEYAEVYPNLAKHDSRYPSSEELIERTQIGNIEFEGDYFNIVLEVTDNGSPTLTRYVQASNLSDCFYWPFLSSGFRNAIIVKQPGISRL